MNFARFWKLYLQGHSLPGTRTIHYFATSLGLLCVLQSLSSRQPLFALGIAVAYALAIGAHRFIELNAPLIKVNPFWGMIADVRMCWLAVTGRLATELEAAGVGVEGACHAKRPVLRQRLLDIGIAVLATLGLVLSVTDLADLLEPETGYSLVPLGVPIVAFCAATAAAFSVLANTTRRLTERSLRAAGSLRRASTVLLVLGTASFFTAEIIEHGVPSEPDSAMMAIAAIAMAVVIGSLLVVLGRPRYQDHPPEAFVACLCKVAGFVGGALAAASGLAALLWQALPTFERQAWRGLSFATLIDAGPGHPRALAWLLAGPSWAYFFALSAALLVLGFAAGERELSRRADRLYADYLAQVRRETPRE